MVWGWSFFSGVQIVGFLFFKNEKCGVFLFQYHCCSPPFFAKVCTLNQRISNVTKFITWGKSWVHSLCTYNARGLTILTRGPMLGLILRSATVKSFLPALCQMNRLAHCSRQRIPVGSEIKGAHSFMPNKYPSAVQAKDVLSHSSDDTPVTRKADPLNKQHFLWHLLMSACVERRQKESPPQLYRGGKVGLARGNDISPLWGMATTQSLKKRLRRWIKAVP